MHRSRWILAPCLAVAALAVVLAGACGGGTPPPGPNVLLVTIETFRADHLGAERDGVALTPNLDAFATEGARFDSAFAAAAFTLPSLHTIATGEPPPVHRVRFWTQFGSAFRGVTMAQELRERGYRTGFVNGHGLLQPYPILQMGFETWQEEREARASWVIERAEAFLDDARGSLDDAPGKPFFLWLHLYEPHTPYAPEETYAEGLADLGAYREAGPASFPVDEWVTKTPGLAGPRLADRLYASEVRAADAAFGRLRSALAERGLADTTVVAVMADHGENLSWDAAPRWDHGWSVARQLVHIPMLMAGPGVPAGVRRTDLAGHIDVAPTLLALSGQAPPAGWLGRDLFSDAPEPPFLVVETTVATRQDRPLYGVVDRHRTLRLDAARSDAHLLDERDAEGVAEPVRLDHPGRRAASFVAHWRGWADIAARRAGAVNEAGAERGALTDEQERLLRMSGYLR